MTRLRRRPLGGGSLEAHYIYNIMEEKCRFLWEDKVDFECRIEAPGAHQHLFFFNGGTPKSSILIGFSIINHPFGVLPFMETSFSHISLMQDKEDEERREEERIRRMVMGMGN